MRISLAGCTRKLAAVSTRARRQTVIAAGILSIAAAVLAGSTAAATAAPATAAHKAAIAASAVPAAESSSGCPGGIDPTQELFWYCNNISWRPLACTLSHNYDAALGTTWNVYEAANLCLDRVWLHQYYRWQTVPGWTYCINPNQNPFGSQSIPVQFQHPLNIFISSNNASC
jgi:hypothetical protein